MLYFLGNSIIILVTTREKVIITQKNMTKESKNTDTKTHQNTQKRPQDKKQEPMDLQNKLEYNEKNDDIKFLLISNYFKCKPIIQSKDIEQVNKFLQNKMQQYSIY